ncbi:unnamed protein product [Commensalibacter communis]|nr:unnamed protein product [Commensalibacter communis]
MLKNTVSNVHKAKRRKKVATFLHIIESIFIQL